MKTYPVGAELFPADRRTDERTNMTKLRVVAFTILWTHLKMDTYGCFPNENTTGA